MSSIASDHAPPVIDDLEIIPDSPAPERATAIRRGMWLPIVPWLWFLIRGLHPALEYLAIGLPLAVLVAAFLTAMAFLVSRHVVWLATLASLAVFFVVAVLAPWRPIDAPAPVASESIRVASVNLGLYWFSDNDAGFFVDRQAPDLIVGTELSESHDAEFRRHFEHAVGDILPLERQQRDATDPTATSDDYRAFGLPSLGVYSSYPMEVLDDPIADRFDGGLPGFRVRVDAPSGPIVVYALHIPKPSLRSGSYQLPAGEHLRLVELIAEAIETERDPVIVLGDLNSVDRSIAYRTLTTNLNDGMRQSGWAVPTADRAFPLTLLFARIDHLLISDSLCAADGVSENTRFSDHRPIVATVGPCEAN